MDPLESQTAVQMKLSNYLALDRFSHGFANNRCGIDKKSDFDRKVEMLEEKFKVIDINQDGTLTSEELLQFLDMRNKVTLLGIM